MAQRFLGMASPPMRQPIVNPKRGGLLTEDWEGWFHRLRRAVLSRPSCHLYFTANQSVANATQQDVLWTAEDHDNATMHSTASNTDRITIPSDGIYRVGAHLGWAANAAGHRQLRISLNDPAPMAAGATLVVENPLSASYDGNAPYFGPPPVTRELSAGDILRVAAYQDSGGALNAIGTTGTGPYANGFWCFRVSST